MQSTLMDLTNNGHLVNEQWATQAVKWQAPPEFNADIATGPPAPSLLPLKKSTALCAFLVGLQATAFLCI